MLVINNLMHTSFDTPGRLRDGDIPLRRTGHPIRTGRVSAPRVGRRLLLYCSQVGQAERCQGKVTECP